MSKFIILRYWILTFVIFSLGFGSACKVLNLEKAKQNPREELLAAMNRMITGKSYRIEEKFGGTTVTLEHLAANRTHLTLKLNKGTSEHYVIDKTFYERKEGSQWVKNNLSSNEVYNVYLYYYFYAEWSPEVKKTEVKFVGEENLNGVKCGVFEYVIQPPVPLNWRGNPKQTTWVSIDDGLPRKTIISGTDSYGVSEESILIFSDFDGNFKIEPPI